MLQAIEMNTLRRALKGKEGRALTVIAMPSMGQILPQPSTSLAPRKNCVGLQDEKKERCRERGKERT